ncbi:FHA domain-containing protein [Kitasatospora sp. NPDC006697]|uniref:FHA domain-containing protein n=1 Tax=Kitasatospora sp. NPDC006697 TaxID=3364020 RepID=UPI00368368BE
MAICPSGHESQSEDYCDYCGLAMRPAGVPFGAAVPPPPPAPPHAPPMPGGFPGATEGLLTCPICRTPKAGRYCEECGYDFDLSTSPGMAVPNYGYPPHGPGQQQAPFQPPSYQTPGQQQLQGQQQVQGYGYPPPGPAYPPQPEPAYPLGDPYGAVPGYPPAEQSVPAPSVEQYGTSFHLAPPSQQVPQAEPVRSNWVAVISADRDYFTDMMARSGPEASGLFFPPYCPERRVPITGRGQLRIGRRSQHRGTVPEIDLSVPPEDPGASHQHALLAEQQDGSWVLVDQDSTNGTTMNGGSEPIAPHTAIALNDGDRIHIGAWTTITLHRA